MSVTRVSAAIAAFSLASALSMPAASAEPLSRQALGQLGKAGTVLVENPARGGYGSAFCVHASGLFVTNEHVIRGSTSVTLIVDSGEKSQRAVKAAVIRADKDLDLALLRAEEAAAGAKFAALEVGPSDGLGELAELVAFGFPFGRDLAPKGEYPSISINVGSVTSLRKKAGELYRIQLDAALNPGNSGGPVLDKSGKVVGVVVSGVQGAGVNFAIPSGHVLQFVSAPDLTLPLPTVEQATIHLPVPFQAGVAEILPSAEPLTVELTLKSGDGPERKLRMEPVAGGGFRVVASPVPPPSGPKMLRAAVTFDGGSVTGSAADSVIRVGGREMRLGEVLAIRLRPKPGATMFDGKTVEGEIAGVEAFVLSLGNEQIRFDLGKAAEARFEPAAPVASVTCTVTVLRGGKEIGRRTEILVPRGAASIASIPSAGGQTGPAAPVGPIAPPALDADKVVRQMPAPIGDIAVGGAGRLLILHFPKLRKLGIFDVSQAKIVNYIPLADDNVKFAAGLDKLIVVLGSTKIIQRWNLLTFERELSATLSVKGVVRSLAMGSASSGPLMVGAVEDFMGGPMFFDIATMKPMTFSRAGHLGASFRSDYWPSVRVSADGTVFGAWHTGLSPSGLNTMVLSGSEIKQHNAHISVGHVIPGPDGRTIFTGSGLWTNECKAIGKGESDGRFCLPANAGTFYLCVQLGDRFSGRNEKTGGVSVHMLGDERALINLTQIDVPALGERWGGQGVPFDMRIHFIPEAKLIITIPQTNDQLVMHRFDIEQALEKSGIDYLLVTSRPPPAAAKGSLFSYRLVTKAKKGGVKYRIESGPKGMAIAADGTLTWAVPSDFADKDVAVIVTVSDAAGQETFHTFNLAVRE